MTKRNFILGDEWIYFKVFSGVQIADNILVHQIRKLRDYLIKIGAIDKWFFIRYPVPKPHLRIRFKLKHRDAFTHIIESINQSFAELLDNDIIFDIDFSTYKREINRYGNLTMDISESIFQVDSDLVISVIPVLKNFDNFDLRWLFGIKIMNTYLTCFNYNCNQKKQFVEMMNYYYNKTMMNNKFFLVNYNNTYRVERNNIEAVLLDNNFGFASKKSGLFTGDINELYTSLSCFSQRLDELSKEINLISKKSNYEVSLDSLVSSYIHMMNNRLFRTNQRHIESELYYFLHKQYSSIIARKEKEIQL